MKKVRIITADFGNHINQYNYELPKQKTNFEIDFQCFNDKNTLSRELSLHPRTKGKIPKMLDWIEYDADYYIWFDSKFKILSENFVDDTIKELDEFDLILLEHPERKSIKSELEFVENQINRNNSYLKSRYVGERMKEQVEFYLKDSQFIDNKLFAMGFFAYTKKLVENKNYNLLTEWFFHNCFWSIQDQLSLPYLLYKHNVKYKTFSFQLGNNKYLKWN